MSEVKTGLVLEGGAMRGIFSAGVLDYIVALDAYQDQLLAALIHIVLHAPGGAVGGVLVEKYIVSVEQIHNGVALFGLLGVAFRQVNIGSANLVSGELWNGNVPFDDHENTSFVPCKIWQFLPLT